MSLAVTAGLLADRTRAAFCLALLDGRAWTAGELARRAGVSASTASEHLSRLVGGGLLVEQRQGRHRYVRLADPRVAALIEDLSSYSPPPPKPRGMRESVRMSAEARARTCYDHLAGALGVAVADAMFGRGLIADDRGLVVTGAGVAWLAEAGVDVTTRRGSRPMVRSCLDWTQRRPHLAGVIGAALCDWTLSRHLVERVGSGRALRVTTEGRRAFTDLLGITLETE
ncbi:winged helix-turn-helix domain-containing protein [Rugosimonospora acidiphila]|uniref:Winged helix-turn-helix domain-containing protein n=1 Tax=Rugosimonospora acidiphila TaxID=556531 RepID=A0ABP9RNN2_9ACTN